MPRFSDARHERIGGGVDIERKVETGASATRWKAFCLIGVKRSRPVIEKGGACGAKGMPIRCADIIMTVQA